MDSQRHAPSSNPPPYMRGIGLHEGFALLRRHFRLMGAVILGCTILSAVVAYNLPKVYTATSAVVLDRNDTRPFEPVAEWQRQERDRSATETEMDIITSRAFAGRVVDAMKLVEMPSFNPYLRKTETDESSFEWFAWASSNLQAMVRNILGRNSPQPVSADPPSAAIQRDRVISSFLSRVKVTRTGESLAMTVMVSNENAKMAAALANAVTNLYVESSVESKRDATGGAATTLRERATQLAARISDIERKLVDHSRENKLAYHPRDDMLRARMEQLNERLTVARVEHAGVVARQNQLRKLVNAGGEVAGTLFTSPLLAELRTEESRLFRQKAELGSSFGANHPKVLNASAELASVRKMIGDEVQRILFDLENEERVALTRVETFEAELDAMQLLLQGRSLAEIRKRELERDLITEQKRYDQIEVRLSDLDLKWEAAKPSSRVVSSAEIPVEPSFPKPRVIVAGGLVGSSVLSIILALMLEAADKRIRTGERTTEILEVPHLAYVPNIPRRNVLSRLNPFAYVVSRPQSAFAEAMRSFYLGCRVANTDSPHKVIMVTSCLPNEGKTSLALGLAFTAAADGKRTALVDLDLRHCGIRSAADIGQAGPALEDFMRGECALQETVRNSPARPGLDFIAPARPATRDEFLLSSDRLRGLLTELRERYDVIVIDTSPVLIVDDANWLSPLVDAVVLVTRWGKTKEDALWEAAVRLRMNQAPVIGTVINRVNPKVHARRGYGGSLKYYKQAQRYVMN